MVTPHPPPIQHPDTRRLKIKDPRVVDRYITMLHDKCSKDNLYELMCELHSRVTPDMPLSIIMIQEFEALNKVTDAKKELCEERRRKLCCGAVPWSSTYKKVNLELDYWIMRQKYLLGVHHNVRQLIVLQNKLRINMMPHYQKKG